MFDIHQKIDDDNDYDEQEAREPISAEEYIDGLMGEFAGSPEGKAMIDEFGIFGWAGNMMDFGMNHIGCTPATMSVRDFDEVLFELFPRKMSTEPENAEPIVREIKAFWTFVARQYDLDNARKILATLDDKAAGRLQKALADPRNWGMAKSLFMKGQKSGFDMTTQEGLDAFQIAYNSSLAGLPPLPALPLFDDDDDDIVGDILPSGPSPKDKDKKKKKRRAARQAKKRNRKK